MLLPEEGSVETAYHRKQYLQLHYEMFILVDPIIHDVQQHEIRKLTGDPSHLNVISAGNGSSFFRIDLFPIEIKFGENSSNFLGCNSDEFEDRVISIILVVCVVAGLSMSEIGVLGCRWFLHLQS